MLAVSIVTYKTPLEELRLCLNALLGVVRCKRIDVIDNSSDNAIKNFIAQYKDSRVIYTPHKNTGYGAGNNVSIRKSLEDPSITYHLVMNSDLVFRRHEIEILLDVMDSDRTIALTTPKITDKFGYERSSYHPLPTPIDLICRRFVPKFLCKERLKKYNVLVGDMEDPIELPYIHGCFMMMRTDALRTVGLFDERFFMYAEDIDLSRRLNARYRTLVVPNISITHYHRAMSRRNLKFFWIHIVSMFRYFNKWGWF